MEDLSFNIGSFTVKPCHLISIAIGMVVVYFIMKRINKKCEERETKVKQNLEIFLSSDYAKGLGIDAKSISAQVFGIE
jgi:hypothetical protein